VQGLFLADTGQDIAQSGNLYMLNLDETFILRVATVLFRLANELLALLQVGAKFST